MVEVSNLDDEQLGKEDGKTGKEALDFLRAIIPSLSEKEKFEFLQYCNFELLKPVVPSNLKFYRLQYFGHPSNLKSFKWKLIEM